MHNSKQISTFIVSLRLLLLLCISLSIKKANLKHSLLMHNAFGRKNTWTHPRTCTHLSAWDAGVHSLLIRVNLVATAHITASTDTAHAKKHCHVCQILAWLFTHMASTTSTVNISSFPMKLATPTVAHVHYTLQLWLTVYCLDCQGIW